MPAETPAPPPRPARAADPATRGAGHVAAGVNGDVQAAPAAWPGDEGRAAVAPPRAPTGAPTGAATAGASPQPTGAGATTPATPDSAPGTVSGTVSGAAAAKVVASVTAAGASPQEPTAVPGTIPPSSPAPAPSGGAATAAGPPPDAPPPRAHSWRATWAAFSDPHLAALLCLGFAAGLPLPLTGFTLRQWLSESGASLTGIGATALIGIAYSFKFVWAPALDRVKLPLLTDRLGRRRGWLLPIQLLLAAAIALLGLTDPAADPGATVAAAVAVAFLSASQDIVIDAWRIESLPPERQGLGLAAYVWGYRFALLVANAGVLFAVGTLGWAGAFAGVAALMAVGVGATLLMPEPAPPPGWGRGDGLGGALRRAVVEPFAEFMRRDGWLALLAFVALFKLGEALAGIMTAPFYRALGFSREEVAAISSVFGLVATLAGVSAGGVLVQRFGIFPALIATGIMQMLSNLMYVALAQAGYSLPVLWLQVGIENGTDGLADAAFVAYLSALTSRAYTATQYALLSSLAAVPLRTLGAGSGWLAATLGWPLFFLLTTAAALPALGIALHLRRRFPDGAAAA